MFCKKIALYRTKIPITGFLAGLMFVLSLCSWSYAYAGEAAISKESVDILTKVGQATAEIVDAQGKKIDDPNQIRNMVAGIEPGQEIEMKIIRENKPITKNVTVSELPTDVQKPAKGEYGNLLNGVSVQELTPEFIERFDIPKKLKGVIVAEVDEESPAFGIIKPGDIIQELNKQNIAGLKDYEKVAAKIKQGEDVMLFIRRGQASKYITLSGK